MFQKPAFGANTSGFGASTSFGGFKSTTGTSAFGAPPAFGATPSTQPATGGGLFGATNTTGGLFGNTTAPTVAPAFGASTSSFGFGANTSSGGLFANNTSSGLFGTSQNTSGFGTKPAGFGFGSTTTTGTTGGLFGTTATTGTGLFGQQNTTLGGGGLFSNTTGAFGQQQNATGTAHTKYNPVVGTDTLVKSGTTQNISIKHHCITCMKEYESKSLEELRLEDYVAGRKGNTAGVFGGFQQPAENKPLFGGTTTFGQPATTSAPSMFGGGALGTAPAFGQTGGTFSFGGNTQTATNTTSLFGANKPAFGATGTPGTGLFGATTTQTSTFGTPTSTFGFGTNTQNQSGGLFGVKPQATTAFGANPATSGFGATPFGGGGLFGAKTQQSTAPTFGTATPAFASLSAGFGTNTTTSTGLFGANTFGKPATSQPTFGFGNTQTAPLGTSLGTGLGAANTLQAKPGNMFQNLQFPQFNNTTFKTGQENTLGSSMFGTNPTLGAAAPSLGGFNSNTTAFANNNLGSSLAGNVHEQILTLAARPYGDSPLFRDLQPDSSTTTEDVLKPTNPAAVKAIMDSSVASSYRVTSPTAGRLKVLPRSLALPHDKKSLFDGLEESDPSLEDKLSLKPSRKRLVLRPNQRNDANNYENEQEQQINNHTGRSPDEADSQKNGYDSSQRPRERIVEIKRNGNEEHGRESVDFPDSRDLEISSNRQGSWLSPQMPWSDKEKPIDGEPTPRLYPNLDKELPPQVSERRASWLTTKPLRKPLVTNPDAIENSVRELGMRIDHSVHDKENIDNLSVSEEENVAPRESPPHPTGVKLTRPGYYTIPSLDEMISYMRPDGSCVVPHLTIGRRNYGNVYYDCEIDVAGLDLDALVYFLNKEVIVYPEDADKPPVGEGLNRRAIVTLDRIWPRDKTEKRPITDPERLLKMDYEGKLRRVCDKHDTKFIEYRPQTGSWVFKVEHFSKYGLTDSDEEDDPTPDVMKRQLVTQSLQKAAPPGFFGLHTARDKIYN